MLYGQIIAWTAVVYVAILTVISIYLIAKVNDNCPKSLIVLFISLIVCAVMMFETFILATVYAVSPILQPMAIFGICCVLVIWTFSVSVTFFEILDD